MASIAKPEKPSPISVLAVSSSGGHWVQLMRLRAAWRDLDVAYLTTEPSYANDIFNEAQNAETMTPRFYTTVAANRWQKWRLVRQLAKIFWVVAKERPDVVCTTGASPGYFAVRLGKLFGARTIWIDSIANVEVLSMAGEKAGPYADAWLTQWEILAEERTNNNRSPRYWGAVI